MSGTGIDLLGPVAGSDVAPDYVGELAAFTCRVLLAACNTSPIAQAGMARTVYTGESVALDGSASSDADRDSPHCAWRLESRPAGSSTTLVAPTIATPPLAIDQPGSHVLSLVVDDGRGGGAEARVTLTTLIRNPVPVADAGPSQRVFRGTVVALDGSASSDGDGDPIDHCPPQRR